MTYTPNPIQIEDSPQYDKLYNHITYFLQYVATGQRQVQQEYDKLLKLMNRLLSNQNKLQFLKLLGQQEKDIKLRAVSYLKRTQKPLTAYEQAMRKSPDLSGSSRSMSHIGETAMVSPLGALTKRYSISNKDGVSEGVRRDSEFYHNHSGLGMLPSPMLRPIASGTFLDSQPLKTTTLQQDLRREINEKKIRVQWLEHNIYLFWKIRPFAIPLRIQHISLRVSANQLALRLKYIKALPAICCVNQQKANVIVKYNQYLQLQLLQHRVDTQCIALRARAVAAMAQRPLAQMKKIIDTDEPSDESIVKEESGSSLQEKQSENHSFNEETQESSPDEDNSGSDS